MKKADELAQAQLIALHAPSMDANAEKITFQYVGGLTKREAFAMAAMQGVLANGTFVHSLTENQQQVIVGLAIDLADALLDQLELSSQL